MKKREGREREEGERIFKQKYRHLGSQSVIEGEIYHLCSVGDPGTHILREISQAQDNQHGSILLIYGILKLSRV